MPHRGYRLVAIKQEKIFVPHRGTTELANDCVIYVERCFALNTDFEAVLLCPYRARLNFYISNATNL